MYNNEFRCVRGREWFRNGHILFDSVDKDTDGFYRSAFGPVYAYDWQTYRNSNRNLDLATRRLTCARLPDTPGEHQRLIATQTRFLLEHHEQYTYLGQLYAHHFDQFATVYEEAHDRHADPHPKRILRMHAYSDGLDRGIIQQYCHTWCNRTVWWKMKKEERGKQGKYPRTIVDIGVTGSLLGSYATKVMKHAQASEPFEYLGGVMCFVASPDPFALENAFLKLIECPARYVFIFFSDDSCLSIRIGARILTVNMDISSCDASHSPQLFITSKLLFPKHMRRHIQLLIDQCKLPLKIKDCNDSKNIVVLIPNDPKLYSGSVLTTFLNNLANMSICMAISETEVNGPDDIVAAALRAGYIVTCDVAEIPEQIQFLKHSPVRDINGFWRPLLNFGVILRSSGMCDGDLPGSGPILPRALAFQRGLLHGAYPRCHFPILDAMKKAVGDGRIEEKAVKLFEYKVVVNTEYPVFSVHADDFSRRYSLTAFDHDLLLSLSIHSFGYSINTDAVRIIGLRDYGIDTTEQTHPSFFFDPGRG